MDIREELPSNYEEEELKKKKLLEQQKKSVAPPTNQLPESVLRAREMMKEADEKIDKKKKLEEDAENKALFELLRELEEEEEEEEKEESEVSTMSNKLDALKHNDEEDEEENFSDEDDDRYDTEISENMFDRFGDDEEYPLDGVIDQEDFSCYDELPPQIPAATIKEIVEEDEVNERSTPKLITKRKPKTEEKPIVPEEPKKMSKFKLAQLEKKNSVESTVKENSTVQENDTSDKPKKFSKFKLLRQQQQDQPRQKAETPVETKVKETVQEAPIQQKQQEYHTEESVDTMMMEPKKKQTLPVENNGIPKVIAKPKKMSRFKLARQQKVEPLQDELIAPVKAERAKPKRTVTWDSNTSVRDHDNTLAPSVVSETASYSQPMKNEQIKRPSLQPKIKSPSDIVRVIKYTQDDIVDDYPSLDDDNDKKVDLNDLIKAARDSSEAFWRPNDGTEALIPMVNEDDDDENDEAPEGIIVAKKNKMDNKIMKGAVMERDIVPVDLEEVEDDMDIREVRPTDIIISTKLTSFFLDYIQLSTNETKYVGIYRWTFFCYKT